MARWLEVKDKEFYYITTMADEEKASADTTPVSYTHLDTIDTRLEMFRHQREVLTQQIQQLQHTLETVEYKCWFLSLIHI